MNLDRYAGSNVLRGLLNAGGDDLGRYSAPGGGLMATAPQQYPYPYPQEQQPEPDLNQLLSVIQQPAPQPRRSFIQKVGDLGGRVVKGSTGADQFSDPEESRAALKNGLLAYGQSRMSVGVDGGQALANMLAAGTQAGQSLQERKLAAAEKLRLQAARGKYLDPSLPMQQRVETALQRAYGANDEEGVKHLSDMLRSMQGQQPSDTTKAPIIRRVESGGKTYDVAVDLMTGKEGWRLETGVVAPKDEMDKDKKLTEGERKAKLLGSLGWQAHEHLNSLESAPSWLEGNMPNFMQSDEFQLFSQARAQFSDVYIRATSGANAPEPEVKRALKMMTPTVGDSKKTLAQKRAAREMFLRGLDANGEVAPGWSPAEVTTRLEPTASGTPANGKVLSDPAPAPQAPAKTPRDDSFLRKL